MALIYQVIQIHSDIVAFKISGMFFTIESNIVECPVNVGFFRTPAQAFPTDISAKTIKEFHKA